MVFILSFDQVVTRGTEAELMADFHSGTLRLLILHIPQIQFPEGDFLNDTAITLLREGQEPDRRFHVRSDERSKLFQVNQASLGL